MISVTFDKNNIFHRIFFRIVPATVILSLGTFVIIATLVGFFPGTFGPIFGDYFLLQETGIYADCSLASNRNNSICTGISQKSQYNRDWASIQKSKKPMPFTLHGG